LVFAAMVLAIAGPWYAAICYRLPGFAQYFLWKHNVVRFVTPFDHQRPIWFYGPVLLAGLMPGSLLAIGFLRFLFTEDNSVAQRRCPALGFILLAAGWCVLFFSVSGSKLPTYILPAFPALALALGYYLAHSRWQQTIWPKAIAGVAFAILFVGHNIALPWYAGYRAPSGRLAELGNYFTDRQIPVVCYPRSCDSVAFYVGRDDLSNYRSKQTHLLVYFLLRQPRTVVLLTHRHSLEGLRHALPPELRVVDEKHLGLRALPGLSEALMEKVAWWMGETSLGLCDLAVIERRDEYP
jgi:hypothetical protein